MESEHWNDINESVKGEWIESTTANERVEDVLLNTRKPLSAPAIAEQAAVSPPTARRRLNRLVELGIASAIQTENGQRYWRNDMYDLTQRVIELDYTTSADELSSSIVELSQEYTKLVNSIETPADVEYVDITIPIIKYRESTEQESVMDKKMPEGTQKESKARGTLRNYMTALATLLLKQVKQS